MQISADKKYKKGADEMFNINDIVTYGISGVCKIVEITEKDLTGVKKTYLVLKPAVLYIATNKCALSAQFPLLYFNVPVEP